MARADFLPESDAFGLRLRPTFRVHGLAPGGGPPRPDAITLRRATEDELLGWKDGAAVPLYGRHAADGRLATCLHSHPRHGHRLFADGFGTYAVSRELDELACVPPPEAEDWDWQRFLVGHALPLAALLSGVEVLHASAVAIDGRVVALVGGSGSGKTSLAFHLAAREGRLFTDDVLAVAVAEDSVVAHPGVGVANLYEAEREQLKHCSGADVGRVIGRAGDDLRVVVDQEAQSLPLPLAAVYFIDRPGRSSRVRFEGADAAQDLLGGTFNLALRDPARLRRHLDLSTALAHRVRTFRVSVPASVSATGAAAAIGSHLAGEL